MVGIGYASKGWIKPNVSPYGSPTLFVPKKTGKLRTCIDFCALDAKMKLDFFFLYLVLLIFWTTWVKLTILVV